MTAANNSAGAGTLKPGYLTTEFWATILTLLLPVLTLIFHKDFSGQTQAFAAAAAGVATAVYSLSRSFAKSGQAKANAAVASAGPAQSPPAQSVPLVTQPGGLVTPPPNGSRPDLAAAAQHLADAARVLTATANAAPASPSGGAAASPLILVVPG